MPACLALSSGQETATVSAVSLTANEFPGGGVVAVYVCVYECVCLCILKGVWTCGVATTTWKKGEGKNRKRIQPPGCSGNPNTPGFRAEQQEELLSQRCYCSARAAAPSCSVYSLLRSETSDSITG